MGQKNKRVFFFFLLQRLFRNEGHKFIVFRTIFWRGKNNEINNLFDGLSYKNQALKKVKFFLVLQIEYSCPYEFSFYFLSLKFFSFTFCSLQKKVIFEFTLLLPPSPPFPPPHSHISGRCSHFKRKKSTESFLSQNWTVHSEKNVCPNPKSFRAPPNPY